MRDPAMSKYSNCCYYCSYCLGLVYFRIVKCKRYWACLGYFINYALLQNKI